MEHRAHPRSRGENDLALGLGHRFGGSSPLTRGKLFERLRLPRSAGLIPAHAGKTGKVLIFCRKVWAHPRSRGENAAPDGLVDPDAGSSPLTRGKRGIEPPAGCFGGLIPAHAGKTRANGRSYESTWAHPRSRGENFKVPDLRRVSQGSSPLTRGKLQSSRPLGWYRRLIPAHAGKTIVQTVQLKHSGAHPRSRGENTS